MSLNEKERRERIQKKIEEAVNFCQVHSIGAKQYFKRNPNTNVFFCLSTLHRRLHNVSHASTKQEQPPSLSRRDKRSILTHDEKRHLAKVCANCKYPLHRRDLRKIVVNMLMKRAKMLQQVTSLGMQLPPLTRAEQRCIQTTQKMLRPYPSDEWFVQFHKQFTTMIPIQNWRREKFKTKRGESFVESVKTNNENTEIDAMVCDSHGKVSNNDDDGITVVVDLVTIPSPSPPVPVTNDIEVSMVFANSKNENEWIGHYQQMFHSGDDVFATVKERRKLLNSADTNKVSNVFQLLSKKNTEAYEVGSIPKYNKAEDGNERLYTENKQLLILGYFLRWAQVTRYNQNDTSVWICSGSIDFAILLLRAREWAKTRIDPSYVMKYIANAYISEAILRSTKNDAIGNQPPQCCLHDVLRLLQRMNPWDQDTMIFPCNLTNQHWMFIVIKPKLHLIVGYDSMCSTSKFKGICALFLKWLEEQYQYGGRQFPHSQQWKQFMYPTPQQSNGVDCGVMMLCGILCAADNIELFYEQSHMNQERERWAFDLLRQQITGSVLIHHDEDFKASCFEFSLSTLGCVNIDC